MSALRGSSGDSGAGGSSRASGGDALGRSSKGSGKKIAECCVELLHMEMIALYTRMQAAQQQQPAQARNELMARRMEAIGFQVGQQLVERYTLDRARFSDHLEVIKFICKDFWAEVFRKQVDNLKTNHRGVFVLQDNKFRWLMRISADAVPGQTDTSAPGPPATAPSSPLTPSSTISLPVTPASAAASAPTPGKPTRASSNLSTSSAAAAAAAAAVGAVASAVPAQGQGGSGAAAASAAASQYLLLPCGIIKGALTNLGVPCTVTAEVSTLPACSFTVRIKS